MFADAMQKMVTNLVLVVASLAVVIGVPELVARRSTSNLQPIAEILRHWCFQRSALLGLELAANCVGVNVGTPVRTNELGLRGGPVLDDGRPRILAIGDSCTFGHRVREAQSYPAQLQRLLDARATGMRYQVVNAGTPGYTSLQGFLYLRERGLALRPAIVIFAYGWNDKTTYGDQAEWLALNRRLLPFLRVSDWLALRSRLWAGLERAMVMHVESTPGRDQRVGPQKFRQNLAQIIRLTRTHGAKPLALSLSPTQGPGPHRDAFLAVTTAERVPVVAYIGPRMDLVHRRRRATRYWLATSWPRSSRTGTWTPGPSQRDQPAPPRCARLRRLRGTGGPRGRARGAPRSRRRAPRDLRRGRARRRARPSPRRRRSGPPRLSASSMRPCSMRTSASPWWAKALSGSTARLRS
jgi:lysophospholipase L1-like esterase